MGKTYKKYLWCPEAAKTIPRKTLYRMKMARKNVINKDALGRSLGLNNIGQGTSGLVQQRKILNTNINTPSTAPRESSIQSDTSSEISSESSFAVSETSVNNQSSIHNDMTSAIENQETNNNTFKTNDDNSSSSSSSSEYPYSPPDDDLINSNEILNSELFPDSGLSLKQSILLTMGHILRHQESKEATASLLKLLSLHMPENSLSSNSLYLFYKHFEEAKNNFSYHMFCEKCKSYIGTDDKRCQFCNRMVKMSECMGKGSYFIVFSIRQQIQALLEKSYNEKNKNKIKKAFFSKGEEYRKLPMKKGRDLSITWNTDGIPVFHSSGYALWPLLYVVNELNFSGQNVVQLGALWFGNDKPEMNSFLKPFVEEMNELSSNGFEHVHDGKSKIIKVFPGPLSCDSVARCTLQNFHQFNGTFGCNWCLNEGRRIPRGNGGARIYDPGTGVKRDIAQTKRDATLAVSTRKPVNGVKGFSVLMLLNYFNLINGFAVDYMHAVCQGVVKATFNLWFDSEHHGEEYYISGKKREEIDQIYLSLKPSDEITRTPRSIKERKQWKANEWRSWLLYYSPVVLESFIPEKYYKHWLKLVTGISFVKHYDNLYGEDNLTFNLHLMLHLPETVRNWGPLWAVSCFQFENMNGKIMKLFHGTQNVPMQIAEKIVILGKISDLAEDTFPNTDKGSAGGYFYDLLRGYPLIQKVCLVSEGIFCYGIPSYHILNTFEKNILGAYQPNGKVDGLVSKFEKISIFGVIYSSKEVAKRNNCGVKLKDGTLGIIESFYSVKDVDCPHLSIVCACNITYFVIIKKLKLYHLSQQKSGVFYKTKVSNSTLAYPVSDINIKVLILKASAFQQFIYVVELKHKFESD